MNKLRNYGEAGRAEELSKWQRDTQTQAREKAKQNKTEDREVKNLIDSIDISEVVEFLLHEVAKSGSSAEGDQPLSHNDFILEKKPEEGTINAECSILARVVHVYPENVRTLAEKHGISLKGAILRVVCHELTHDYSKTGVEGDVIKSFPVVSSSLFRKFFSSEKPRPAEKIVVRGGYSKTENTRPAFDPSEPSSESGRKWQQKDFFINLDEGVTEKVAIEVMKDYLHKHKDFLTPEEQEQLFSVLTDKSKGAYYSEQVALVDEVIDRLCEESGFDRKLVWQAIKRGKFGKENTNDPETVAVLKDALSDNDELYRKIFNDEKVSS